MSTKPSRRLPDDVLPDGKVERCGRQSYLVQACAVPHATASGSGRIRLTSYQLRAFHRLVQTKSHTDAQPTDLDVTAIDLGAEWILPRARWSQRIRFVRVGLDEFWFEKRDGTAVCQLTAAQTQSLVEHVAELEVSVSR